MSHRKPAAPIDDYIPTPPFAALPNPDADRGHRVVDDGQCKDCKALRPRGGWNYSCPRGDSGQFQGG